MNPEITQKEDGQSALHGAYLWQLVNCVVLLKKNMWSVDPQYTELLSCVRIGEANKLAIEHPKRKMSQNMYLDSDYKVLLNQSLNQLSATQKASFKNAPVIVSEKTVCDVINT
jgi:hypothetical protein